MSESQLQSKIIKYLRDRGAFVIKTRPGMGTPRGTPDIVALYYDAHCEIEVKASPSAPYQPGQEAALNFLRRGGHIYRRANQFTYRVDPENWPEVQAELDRDFF